MNHQDIEETPEIVNGFRVRPSVRYIAESCARATTAFITPKAAPCGRTCVEYNAHRQCVSCGWLRPLGPDDPYREVPMGPAKVCRLGLTADELSYVVSLGV